MLRGVARRVEKDACGVVEAAFSREHPVRAGSGKTPLCVTGVEDISVCKDDCLWGKVVAEMSDRLPVCEPRVVAFLLPCASVYGEDASPARENHFGILESLVFVGKDADFGSHWDGEGVRVVELGD